MLNNAGEFPVLRAWRSLATGGLDRHDVGVLRDVVAGSSPVRASGLSGLDRTQLVDDVVCRLWRSASRQGARWLERPRGHASPEGAMRAYIAAAVRSALIDRIRSTCGENSDVEALEDEPARHTDRDWLPVRLWSDVLGPTTPELLDDLLVERTVSLLGPLTDEKGRALLRLRVRCRLASPSEVPALVGAFLAKPAASSDAPTPPMTDLELRRRRNALDVAMSRLAKRLWSRLDDESLDQAYRRRCRHVAAELFGAILGRPTP